MRAFLCPWMDGIQQGARKAVRLCPWMDGLKIAPCIFRTPHVHVGRFRKEPGRRCGYVQEVRAENCSMHFPHSPRPCGSFSQGAREGGAIMYRKYGLKIAPCIFHTSHVRVGRFRKEPGKAVRLCPWMDGIPQRARMAVRLCPWMDGIPQRARMAVRLCNVKLTPASLAVLFIASRFTPHNSGRLPRLFNHSSCTGR